MQKLSDIINQMGERQLKFNRINASQFIKDIASTPSVTTFKTPIPNYFREIFNHGFSISAHPFGIKSTLWHCLLYAFSNERYMHSSWGERQQLVEHLIEQLDLKSQTLYGLASKIRRNTTLNYSMLNLRNPYPDDFTIFTISLYFDVNILVLNHINWNFYYATPAYQKNLPLIILNKDQQQCYSLISLNGDTLFSPESSVSKTIFEHAPKRNKFLLSHLRPSGQDENFIRLVKGQSEAEYKLEQYQKSLSKLKLSELKQLVYEYNPNFETSGRLTKAKLIGYLSEQKEMK